MIVRKVYAINPKKCKKVFMLLILKISVENSGLRIIGCRYVIITIRKKKKNSIKII